MNNLLTVDNLHVSYGRFKVLSNLSFEVPKGQVLGVIGPNGAGKTTLMNALIGLVIPTEGTILFDGHDITKLNSSRRCHLGIGRTYQVPRLFENMSVYENTLVGAVHGARKPERASKEWCLEILNQTGLYDKRNTLTMKLALLDRKRIEIARALATNPSLLLLDEVSAGLTKTEVDEVIALVESLQNTGLTIIWIEHIIKTMVEATDSLLCLSGGTKLVHGDPVEIIQCKEVEEVYLGAEEEDE